MVLIWVPLMNNDAEHFFHITIGHLYAIALGKSIQVLRHFLMEWVIPSSFVVLEEILYYGGYLTS